MYTRPLYPKSALFVLSANACGQMNATKRNALVQERLTAHDLMLAGNKMVREIGCSPGAVSPAQIKFYIINSLHKHRTTNSVATAHDNAR